MAKIPKFLKFTGWRKNPAWKPTEPTIANIKVDRYLSGNVHAVMRTNRRHRPAYRDTLARLALAAHRAGYGPGGSKGKVRVSSSYRTRAEQERLYAIYKKGGNLAAVPGTSAHERGLAVDVPDVRYTHPLIEECRKLGLKDDVPSEKWHLTNHAWKG